MEKKIGAGFGRFQQLSEPVPTGRYNQKQSGIICTHPERFETGWNRNWFRMIPDESDGSGLDSGRLQTVTNNAERFRNFSIDSRRERPVPGTSPDPNDLRRSGSDPISVVSTQEST